MAKKLTKKVTKPKATPAKTPKKVAKKSAPKVSATDLAFYNTIRTKIAGLKKLDQGFDTDRPAGVAAKDFRQRISAFLTHYRSKTAAPQGTKYSYRINSSGGAFIFLKNA